MTPYQQAFLDLINQRDTLYLQLLATAAVGFFWYRLWLWRIANLARAGALLLFGLAWLWGVWQLTGGF